MRSMQIEELAGDVCIVTTLLKVFLNKLGGLYKFDKQEYFACIDKLVVLEPSGEVDKDGEIVPLVKLVDRGPTESTTV